MSFVRSRQRVIDHGEVFTPPELVEGMLSLVSGEASRIDSRFLEPACGSGNFLVPVLKLKLATAAASYGRSEFEYRHQGLLALMSIYGIEILSDNVAECRSKLLDTFINSMSIAGDEQWQAAASNVLEANIVHGDALSMKTITEPQRPIAFAEWSYLGKGRYQRRDFRFDALTQMSSFSQEDTLFADLGKHEIFTPLQDHGQLSVTDIARGGA